MPDVHNQVFVGEMRLSCPGDPDTDLFPQRRVQLEKGIFWLEESHSFTSQKPPLGIKKQSFGGTTTLFLLLSWAPSGFTLSSYNGLRAPMQQRKKNLDNFIGEE